MKTYVVIVLSAIVCISTTAAAEAHATRFEGEENPLSEGGKWQNAGLDWTSVRTSHGLAFGTQTGTNTGARQYDDSYAHLSGFPPNQEAWGQAYIAEPDSSCHQELEILLRWASAPHRTTGYECFARCLNNEAAYVQIVRWEGPLGKFTYLSDLRGTNYGLKHGDILKASIVGNVITVSINGVEKARVTDDTYKTGDPGVGLFLHADGGQGMGSSTNFGFASFAARGLGETNQPNAPSSSASPQAAETWADISSSLLERLTNSGAKLAWPGGCAGVVVNRLDGEVTVKVVGCGLWRSSDKGRTWQRIDNDTISGRDETGWATSVDQNAPARMATFSLDGSAGWTTDGRNWKRFTSLGRNWDFGSVDWSASVPKTIIAAKHETSPPGEVYATTDGGSAWKKLAIHLSDNRERISMVGALDATTFIYSKDEGIHRSTDTGATWTKVSSANPQTRVPVLFRGAHYLGTATGLLVSKDQGANWQPQGAAADIWLGPFFGHDEKEMVVVGKDGVFITKNTGETWTRAASLKAKEGNYTFSPNWFGCYAWDPVNHLLYTSAMGNPVYRLAL